MALNNDVDMIFLQTTHIDFRFNRSGCSEKYIGYFRRHHRATPAISKGSPAALVYQVLMILIHSNCCPMLTPSRSEDWPSMKYLAGDLGA